MFYKGKPEEEQQYMPPSVRDAAAEEASKIFLNAYNLSREKIKNQEKSDLEFAIQCQATLDSAAKASTATTTAATTTTTTSSSSKDSNKRKRGGQVYYDRKDQLPVIEFKVGTRVKAFWKIGKLSDPTGNVF